MFGIISNKLKQSILIFFIGTLVFSVIGCSSSGDRDYTFTFPGTITTTPSVEKSELITPTSGPGATVPETFHLIQDTTELADFRRDFFEFSATGIPEPEEETTTEDDESADADDDTPTTTFFDTGMLLIHPVATKGADINGIQAQTYDGNCLLIYNMEDASGDDQYKLILVYLKK